MKIHSREAGGHYTYCSRGLPCGFLGTCCLPARGIWELHKLKREVALEWFKMRREVDGITSSTQRRHERPRGGDATVYIQGGDDEDVLGAPGPRGKLGAGQDDMLMSLMADVVPKRQQQEQVKVRGVIALGPSVTFGWWLLMVKGLCRAENRRYSTVKSFSGVQRPQAKGVMAASNHLVLHFHPAKLHLLLVEQTMQDKPWSHALFPAHTANNHA